MKKTPETNYKSHISGQRKVCVHVGGGVAEWRVVVFDIPRTVAMIIYTDDVERVIGNGQGCSIVYSTDSVRWFRRPIVVSGDRVRFHPINCKYIRIVAGSDGGSNTGLYDILHDREKITYIGISDMGEKNFLHWDFRIVPPKQIEPIFHKV